MKLNLRSELRAWWAQLGRRDRQLAIALLVFYGAYGIGSEILQMRGKAMTAEEEFVEHWLGRYKVEFPKTADLVTPGGSINSVHFWTFEWPSPPHDSYDRVMYKETITTLRGTDIREESVLEGPLEGARTVVFYKESHADEREAVTLLHIGNLGILLTTEPCKDGHEAVSKLNEVALSIVPAVDDSVSTKAGFGLGDVVARLPKEGLESIGHGFTGHPLMERLHVLLKEEKVRNGDDEPGIINSLSGLLLKAVTIDPTFKIEPLRVVRRVVAGVQGDEVIMAGGPNDKAPQELFLFQWSEVSGGVRKTIKLEMDRDGGDYHAAVALWDRILNSLRRVD